MNDKREENMWTPAGLARAENPSINPSWLIENLRPCPQKVKYIF